MMKIRAVVWLVDLGSLQQNPNGRFWDIKSLFNLALIWQQMRHSLIFIH